MLVGENSYESGGVRLVARIGGRLTSLKSRSDW